MIVNIEAHGFALTPAMRVWVNQQIGACLSKQAGSIRAIDVKLSATTSQESPDGRLAAFNLYLKHRAPMRITTGHANLYTAISISARRSEHAVEKAVTTRRRSVRAEARRWRNMNTANAPI